MSYILEALKKAEAERQLGVAPTIHAPVLDNAAPRTGMLRKPLVVAVGALAGAIAVLAAVLWQRAPSVAAAPAAVAAVPAPLAQPGSNTVAVPVAAPLAAPPSAPVVVSAPPIVAAAAPAPPPAEPAPKPDPKQEPKLEPRSEPKPAPKPADEPVQSLADLPEPIRRAIPSFSMDGYMYSANPADRLVLIDKVLRREGDEVAPGLVLEKLLPKGAVFSFRGYRYRVAF